MSYDLGDGVYLRHEVRDSTGALINATVALTVTAPSGSVTHPNITNTATGIYDADAVIANENGNWLYTWSVTGTIVDVSPGSFIIGPKPDMLASPEDLNALLQTTVDTTTAELLLQSATAVIQAIVGQRIVQVVNDVLVIDLDYDDRSQYLVLPERPVTAVASVLLPAGILATSNYAVQLSRSRIWRAIGWQTPNVVTYGSPTTVTVTYTHGYPPESPKLQLARSAALTLARGLANNPTGATRLTIDDYTETYSAMSSTMDSSEFLSTALRTTYGKPYGSARLMKAER